MHVTGKADPATAWHRYADLDAWTQWSPQIRRVDTGPVHDVGVADDADSDAAQAGSDAAGRGIGARRGLGRLEIVERLPLLVGVGVGVGVVSHPDVVHRASVDAPDLR